MLWIRESETTIVTTPFFLGFDPTITRGNMRERVEALVKCDHQWESSKPMNLPPLGELADKCDSFADNCPVCRGMRLRLVAEKEVMEKVEAMLRGMGEEFHEGDELPEVNPVCRTGIIDPETKKPYFFHVDRPEDAK